MSKKFVTKVIAGAAFGGASLLIAMPGMAVADDAHHERDHKKFVEGWVYAYPDHSKAGKTVHIVQICKDPVEFPSVVSDLFDEPIPLEPGTDPDKIFDRDGKHHKKDGKHHKRDGKKHHKLFDDEDAEDEVLGDGKRHHRDKGRHHFDPKDPKHHKLFEDAEDAENEVLGDGKRHHRDKGRHHFDPKDPKHHDKKHDKKHDKFKKHDDHPWAYFAEVTIPKHAKPGKYELIGDCGEGKLVVVPSGWVDGGEGGGLGATSTSAGLLAGGAGMLAAAALGGTALLRRRTTDGSLA